MTPMARSEHSFAVVVTQPGTAVRLVFECEGEAIAGREATCDIHLPHPLVSRRHARIAFAPGTGFTVEDLGSRNGTVVNGQTIDGPYAAEGSLAVGLGPFVLAIGVGTSDETWTAAAMQGNTPRTLLDTGKRQFHVDGSVVLEALSTHEFAFLNALFRSAPNVVSRTAAGDAVWGEGQWDVYMLHNLVSRLRRRIGQQGSDDGVVVTVPGVGYRLE